MDDDLTRIRRQLDELRDELDGKPDTWDLEQLNSDLRQRQQELRHQVEAQAASLDDLDRDLRGELDEAIEKLKRRLQWVERFVRAADGVTTADLDPDDDTIALARRAARGRQLEQQRLSPADRAALNVQIEQWDKWQRHWHLQQAAALDASRAIAHTEPHARGFEVPTFHAAYRELADLDQRREPTFAAAQRATQQLAADDAQRTAHAGAIDRGQRDWTTLTTRLRTRLADAVDQRKLLPVWFTTVLGHGPPPTADRWLEIGTDLLAYRATYGITDPVVALGPKPDPTSSRRRTWHADLTHGFRAYH